MDTTLVGIDVSKNTLDVHIRPSGEAFAVPRDADGIAALVARLAPLSPQAVGIEASGGFETVVSAGLMAAGLPVALVNPGHVRAFAVAIGSAPRPTPSTPPSSPTSSTPPSRRSVRCPTRKPGSSPISSPAAARSSP